MALRIKLDVDLKELEKFGFDTSASDVVQGISLIDFSDNWIDDHFGMIVGNGLAIWDTSREIIEWDEFDGEHRLDTLYSLIEAGLVEKV